MNLDKRIKEMSDVLTVVNFGIASNFIGKDGYFGNSILDFQRLDTCYHGELTGLIHNTDRCFEYEDCAEHGRPGYSYFIPDSKLAKNPEKKYRPFTLEEWLKRFSLGDEVVLRPNDGSGGPIHSLFVEYNDDVITLGRRAFTFMDLFIRYELFDDIKWVPFGRMEE